MPLVFIDDSMGRRSGIWIVLFKPDLYVKSLEMTPDMVFFR